uniref:Sulfotransferase domain-containing protein n=4 Tax=Photinus pyralis TaxID=7054 RepID=A0A1Y1MY42_PHOPY
MPERYEPNSIEYCKNLKSPRIFKTHLSQEYLPKQLFSKEKKAKIIYIARNIKDVCLSGYHFQTNVLNLPYKSLESYAEVFMSDAFPKGDYWKNVLYFWNRRDENNILFIRYEDMKKDLKDVIRKVTKFLGKSMTSKQEEDLLKWLSIESFQKNTAVNQASFFKTDEFVREGKVGGHKKEMTPELISNIDSWSAGYIKCSDYEYEL